MTSPANTLITGTNGSITDPAGKVWTINSSQQVAVNGTADTSTASVTELFFDKNQTVWQQAQTPPLWWQSPNNTPGNWVPGAGTSASPVPTAEAITINAIPNQGTAAFTVSGSVSVVTAVPTLQYAIDSGAFQALPSGSVVTLNASGVGATFSFPVSGLSAGSHTISVKDAGTGASSTTWNASDKSSGITLSNGNLTAAASGSGAQAVRSTTSLPSGVRAWVEFTATTISDQWTCGLANSSYVLTNSGEIGSDANAAGAYLVNNPESQGLYTNNTALNYSSTYTPDVAGAVLTLGIDTNTSPPTVYFSTPKMRANGFNWNNSATANPNTLTGGLQLTGLTGSAFYAIFGDTQSASSTANFGASTFTEAVPSANNWKSWNAATGSGSLVSATSNSFTVTTHAASPNNSVLGTVTTLYDVNGVAWGINGSGQVTIGGTADTSAVAPTGVIELAEVSSTIWALNANLQWQQNASLTAGAWGQPQAQQPFSNTAPPKSITIAAIPTETASTAFTVSGTLGNYTAAPTTLQYMDSTSPGTWTNLPSPTVTATGYSFSHPGLAAGSNYQVSIRDSANLSVVVTSNPFSVAAAATPTITGITLSNYQVTANAASGTTVGTLAVQESGGTFSGSLALSGTNGAAFSISGTTLKTAQALAAGTYSVIVTATQSGASGSPFNQPFTITSVAATPGVSFNLGAPANQTVHKEMFGFATGALIDNSFSWATDTNTAASIATISPTLLRFNTFSGGSEGLWLDAMFPNGASGNMVTSVLDPWFTANQKFFAPGNRLVVGIGPCSADVYQRSAQDWATIAARVANYFKSKGQECFYWEVGNELNQGVMQPTDYCTLFNAVSQSLKGVNPNYKVGGPCSSWADSGIFSTFVSQCAGNCDFIDWHGYLDGVGNDPNMTISDAQYYANALAGDSPSAEAVTNGTPMAGLPFALLEYNMYDTAPADGRQHQYQGAVCTALRIAANVNHSGQMTMMALWDITQDSNYGATNGSTIYPVGYFLGKAGQVLFGQLVPLTFSVKGNMAGFGTVNANSFAAVIINYDTAASYTIGLNPTPPAGKAVQGSLNTWVIGSSSTTSPTTGAVSPGGSFTLPHASVLIVTGTFA